MNSHLNLSNTAGVEIVRPAKPQAQSDLTPHGHFKVEHWRDGKLIGEYEFPNGVTDEGKKKILDVMFHDATKVSTWYIGLIDGASFSALDATDVYQQINGKGGDGMPVPPGLYVCFLEATESVTGKTATESVPIVVGIELE